MDGVVKCGCESTLAELDRIVPEVSRKRNRDEPRRRYPMRYTSPVSPSSSRGTAEVTRYVPSLRTF
jgi:hypothetical protein